MLSDGFYSLEEMVRLLLRHRLGVASEAWPLDIQETNLKRPLGKVAERLRGKAKVTMRLLHDRDAAESPDG
ncbi:hypothetical protein GCM10009718_29940 [Isoptericola halotolerans]